MHPASTNRVSANNHGFSLTELLVATALGLLAISAGLRAYADIRSSAAATEHRAELEERLNFAAALMEEDILLAGYWGLHGNAQELSLEPDVTVYCGSTNVSAQALQLEQSLVAAASLPLPCPTPGKQKPGSDTLTVRHASSSPVEARANSVQLQASFNGGRVFADGSIVDDGLMQVHDVQIHSWYIDTHSSEAMLPSLRRLTLVHGQRMQNDEIMPGIEDLHVMLGIDSNNDGNIDSLAKPGETGAAAILTVNIELTAQLPEATGLPPLTVTRTLALRNRPTA